MLEGRNTPPETRSPAPKPRLWPGKAVPDNLLKMSIFVVIAAKIRSFPGCYAFGVPEFRGGFFEAPADPLGSLLLITLLVVLMLMTSMPVRLLGLLMA